MIERFIKRAFLISCASVFAIGMIGLAVNPWIGFSINLTESLPDTLYIIHKGAKFRKGDLVAYRWHGGATYPEGTTFIKQLVGEPGDRVRVVGTQFWVNDHFVGVAKPQSKAGVPLTPAHGGTIKDGEFFMATPHPDSLDSRYALSGNIKQSATIGKAHAIF